MLIIPTSFRETVKSVCLCFYPDFDPPSKQFRQNVSCIFEYQYLYPGAANQISINSTAEASILILLFFLSVGNQGAPESPPQPDL